MAKHKNKSKKGKTLEDKYSKGRSNSLKEASEQNTLGNFNGANNVKPESKKKKIKGALYIGVRPNGT